jgi:hypothetical protein
MLAWHYTTGKHFLKTVESGVLLPSANYIAKTENPVLWFSCEQYWEPTAQKAELQDDELVQLGMDGTFIL